MGAKVDATPTDRSNPLDGGADADTLSHRSQGVCVKARVLGAVIATLFLLMGAQVAMAVEEASYTVLKSEGQFEVREYAPHVVAETLVEGGFEDAGSRAFRDCSSTSRATTCRRPRWP